MAVDQADTVLAALDGVIEKMENQLRQFKEQLKEHRATGHKHLEPPPPADGPELAGCSLHAVAAALFGDHSE